MQALLFGQTLKSSGVNEYETYSQPIIWDQIDDAGTLTFQLPEHEDCNIVVSYIDPRIIAVNQIDVDRAIVYYDKSLLSLGDDVSLITLFFVPKEEFYPIQSIHSFSSFEYLKTYSNESEALGILQDTTSLENILFQYTGTSNILENGSYYGVIVQ